MKVGDKVLIICGRWGLTDFVGTIQIIHFLTDDDHFIFLDKNEKSWIVEVGQALIATTLIETLS